MKPTLELEVLDGDVLLLNAEHLKVDERALLGLGVTIHLDAQVGSLRLPLELALPKPKESKKKKQKTKPSAIGVFPSRSYFLLPPKKKKKTKQRT
jgi:hypothetical protein